LERRYRRRSAADRRRVHLGGQAGHQRDGEMSKFVN
jgi:hypothetical protein